MKVYETRVIPAREERACVGRGCDLCGREAKRGDGWAAGRYEVADTEVTVVVRCETGTHYPQSPDLTRWDVDLCPDCFESRLVPWLRAQGAKVEPTEVYD